MSKRQRQTSAVWLFFSEDADIPRMANCTMERCSAKKRALSRGPPTVARKDWSCHGMWRHLETHHPEEYARADGIRKDAELKRQKEAAEEQQHRDIYNMGVNPVTKQPTLQQTIDRKTKWPSDSCEQKKHETNLVNWMVDTLQPYSVVENDRFKVMFTKLQPKYTPPSEKVIRQNMIPSLYLKLQYKIKNLISKHIEEAVDYCITTDIWSSAANDSYISVTMHFITKDYQRKMAVLRALPYNESHTSESIRAKILQVVADWGLPKPTAILRDSAANITKAFLDEWALSCFCHTLQLVVKHSVMCQSGVNC